MTEDHPSHRQFPRSCRPDESANFSWTFWSPFSWFTPAVAVGGKRIWAPPLMYPSRDRSSLLGCRFGAGASVDSRLGNTPPPDHPRADRRGRRPSAFRARRFGAGDARQNALAASRFKSNAAPGESRRIDAPIDGGSRPATTTSVAAGPTPSPISNATARSWFGSISSKTESTVRYASMPCDRPTSRCQSAHRGSRATAEPAGPASWPAILSRGFDDESVSRTSRNSTLRLARLVRQADQLPYGASAAGREAFNRALRRVERRWRLITGSE